MIGRLKSLLAGMGADTAPDSEDDGVHLAAAALLVEAAMMDGGMDDGERARIAQALSERLSVPRGTVDSLIERAQSRTDQSTQLIPFTRILKDALPYDERTVILEMLWEIAYANGELHDYESNLVRRIAGLLFVSDRDSGEARKRALARLGIA
ncbi:MAG: TerB family tellurite resistance protein [Alphaproteobacteria bacterium]|nr:TerB family tellurite resistance protein [Alphaproteobacteria bacterium]